MKIMIFNGSPRGEWGNTQVMVEAFAKGASQAGADVETVFLAQKEIQHCRGCLSCWLKTPGRCVIKDDMEGLLEKVKGCDVVVFATPLYVDNVTGIMKSFMDRLIPLGDPHFNKDENGECKHAPRVEKVPKVVVISNCGFPEQSHFQVLRLLFRRVARNMNTDVIGEIYRGAGAMLAEHPVIIKPLIYRYRQLVRQAGKEIVEQGRISQDLHHLLEKPLLPDDMYISNANKYFDKVLAELQEG